MTTPPALAPNSAGCPGRGGKSAVLDCCRHAWPRRTSARFVRASASWDDGATMSEAAKRPSIEVRETVARREAKRSRRHLLPMLAALVLSLPVTIAPLTAALGWGATGHEIVSG